MAVPVDVDLDAEFGDDKKVDVDLDLDAELANEPAVDVDLDAESSAEARATPEAIAAETERQKTGKRKLFETATDKAKEFDDYWLGPDGQDAVSEGVIGDLSAGANRAMVSWMPGVRRDINPAFGEPGKLAAAANIAGGVIRSGVTAAGGAALTGGSPIGGAAALMADRAYQIETENQGGLAETFDKHPYAATADIGLTGAANLIAPGFGPGVMGVVKPLATDFAVGAGQGTAQAIGEGAGPAEAIEAGIKTGLFGAAVSGVRAAPEIKARALFRKKGDVPASIPGKETPLNVEPTGKGQGQAPGPEVAPTATGGERKGGPSSLGPESTPAQGAAESPVGEQEKYAGSVNVKRFAPDSPEEQAYIHKLYQDNQKIVDEQRGMTGKPGESKFSRKSLRERAAEHEWTDEKVSRLKPNQALNDEQATSLDNFARGFMRVARESKSPEDIARAVNYLKASSGVASAQGRALGARNEARNAWVNSMEPADRAAFNLSRFYKNREIPKDIMEDLLKVDPTDEIALAKVVKKAAQREAGAWGAFKNFRYFNMLSSPITWGLNAVNGVAMSIADPIERQLRTVIDVALPGKRATASGENRAALAGQIAGAADGMRRFLYVMQNGFTPNAAKALDPAKIYTEMPGGGKNPMNWPSRILEATDQFFMASAEGAELNSLAFRKAHQEGVAKGKSGAELDGYVTNRASEIMQNDQEMRKMASEYAQRRTHREKMPQVLESFSQTANSSLGDIEMGGKRLGDSSKLFKPLDYVPNPVGTVAPFIRIPFNSLKKGALDYGPQGLLTSTAVGATKGRAEGTRTAAQAVLGTAILGAAAPLVMSGRITGAVPTDPGKREAFYEARKKPYSFQFFDGGTWFDYRVLGSLALPFIEATAAHDAWKENGEVLDGTAAAKTLGRIGQYSIDSSYLAGINGILSAMANPESTKAESSLANILSQFVPAAALQRFINNSEGSQLPDTNTLSERVVGGTLFKDTLPARKNQLGQDIKRGGNFPSESNADPVYKELNRLEMGVPQASRMFKAKSGKMEKYTPEQYREILASGSPAYENLKRLVASPEYAALSDDKKQAKIKAQFEVLLAKRDAKRRLFNRNR